MLMLKKIPTMPMNAGRLEANQPGRPPRVREKTRCEPKSETRRERHAGDRCQTSVSRQQGERREKTETVNAHADQPTRATSEQATHASDEPAGPENHAV